MATINLGAIKFNWKGAYNSGTSYAVDDVVSSGGNSYVCIQAHSNQAVGNATAYWNIMSSAGTNGSNGTDLTSTLTTRGDIVYKGASALERLPKGTAGYYLKQGANDPEWAELSGGDFVKINTTNISNGAGTVYLDSVFTSAYNTYKIYMTQLKGHDSTNGSIYWKFRTGSSTSTGSYWRAGNANWKTSSATNASAEGAGGGLYNDFGGWNAPDTDTERGNAIQDDESTVYGMTGRNYISSDCTK